MLEIQGYVLAQAGAEGAAPAPAAASRHNNRRASWHQHTRCCQWQQCTAKQQPDDATDARWPRCDDDCHVLYGQSQAEETTRRNDEQP